MSDSRSSEALLARVKDAHEKTQQALEIMNSVLIGQSEVNKLTLATLMASRHCLMTGPFGLGKTTILENVAKIFNLQAVRIQCTSDLSPLDITGMDVRNNDTGEWEPYKGPILSANIVMFDEVNRAPPRTQSATLQAMQEKEVSIGDTVFPLMDPFHAVATRNPIEKAIYPLSEAQLDRFGTDIWMNNPSFHDEIEIQKAIRSSDFAKFDSIMDRQEYLDLQRTVKDVGISIIESDFVAKATMISRRFRPGEEHAYPGIEKFVTMGPSGARSTDTLIDIASALAIIDGDMTPGTGHLARVAAPVIRHRLYLNFAAKSEGLDIEKLINRVVQDVLQNDVSSILDGTHKSPALDAQDLKLAA